MKSHWKWISFLLFVLLFAIDGFWKWSQIGDYQNKLWLHRCNSLEKREEQEHKYSNIEVDLVYRGHGKFDVTHDPDTTFGLYIDSYLPDFAQTDDHLWLDIKNINQKNCIAIQQDLDSLCNEFDIDKEQLIIEGKDWKALKHITNHDFYTSFYVPFDKPSRLTDEEIEDCIDSLQYIADSKNVSALSFPGWWYDEIKEDLDRPIDLLTWKHRTIQWQFLMDPSHYEMMRNPQLKVILIKSKGDFHR